MTFARPKMPGLTYIAGIHIKKPKPLPSDVQVRLSKNTFKTLSTHREIVLRLLLKKFIL